MMKRHSIIQQMAAIFLIGILIVGLLTFLLVQHRTSRSIEAQVESIANNIPRRNFRARSGTNATRICRWSTSTPARSAK